MTIDQNYIESLKKEIHDLKEQIFSQFGMFEMTTSYLQKIQADLAASEQALAKANKRFTDSITYAKKIQDTFLLQEATLQKYFPCSFIIQQPKEIVSGDFVYAIKHKRKTYLIAGDCTGHGVPAAMLTVFVITTLHQIFQQKDKLSPSQVLQELDRLMQQYLSNKEIKDSAEIAVLCVDANRKKATFAGAKRPLVMVAGGEAVLFKGAKFYPGNARISTESPQDISVDIPNKACLYLFSDGITDQFGANRKEKFTTKQLLKLLNSVSLYDVDEQRQQIISAFDSWKQQETQTDDILLIGIKT